MEDKRSAEKKVKMQASAKGNPGQLCNICGDVGKSEYLVSCDNCKSHELIYCTRFPQKVVPEKWKCEACEACEARSSLVSPSSGLKNSFSNMNHHERSFGASSSFHGQELQSSSEKQKMISTGSGSCRLPVESMRIGVLKPVDCWLNENIPMKVATGKVKYLQVQEAYKLSSGDTRKASCARSGFNLQTTRSPVSGSTAPNSSHMKAHQLHVQTSQPCVPSKLLYKPPAVYKLSSGNTTKSSSGWDGFDFQSTGSAVSGSAACNSSHAMAHQLHGQTSLPGFPSKQPYKPPEVYKLSSGNTTNVSCAWDGFNLHSTRNPLSGSAAPNSSHQLHGQISPPDVSSNLPYKPPVHKLSSCDVPPKASRARDGFNFQRTRSPVYGRAAPNSSHLMFHQLHGQTSPPGVPSKLSTAESSRMRMTAAEKISSLKPQMSSSKVYLLSGTEKNNAEMHRSPSNEACSGTCRDIVKEKSGKEASRVFNDYAFIPLDEDGILYSDTLFKFEEPKLRNCPVTEVAWKGGFEVKHSDFYDEFQAHYPRKVSKKAYKFSKGMPGILQFMLQPRCDVWPKIFREGFPSVEDISLYFFPGHFNSAIEEYRSLHNLICTNDLSLRSRMGNVELLLFSSQHLPANSHKLNKSFYLWGVFRSMK